jgi:hypothetical protein
MPWNVRTFALHIERPCRKVCFSGDLMGNYAGAETARRRLIAKGRGLVKTLIFQHHRLAANRDLRTSILHISGE